MQVVILENADAVAREGAALVAAQLADNPASVLGLATGGTPIALYQELVREHRAGALSFAKVTTFNLDEYVGLPPEHPQSYRSFMRARLFDQVDIDPARTHLPEAQGGNPLRIGALYEAAIAAAGGIDLQILGIGIDGHIGFNEPSSSLGSRTRVKTLTARTRQDNARFFPPGEQTPELAITMGIATILDARKIVMLATGAHKADTVAQMIEGPLRAMCPASALQLHPRTCVLLDQDAADKLEMTDYYRRGQQAQQTLLERYED